MDRRAVNKENIKRVVLIGHSGFIGRHLENHFKACYPDKEFVGVSLPEFDLTKRDEMGELSDIFSSDTAVIMCAAIKRQYGDDLDSFLKNISMILNLCHLLEESPVKRFVYFSSTAVYGEDIHNLSITESTPVYPTSYYGIAKYASECLLNKIFSSGNKGSLVILRPPTIYGPGDMAGAYGPMGFLRKALNGEEIVLWGDGSELREFIFVEDIVKLVDKLVFSESEGVLNTASGTSCSFKEILSIISQLLSTEISIDSRSRTKDKVDNVFANDNFIKVFGNFHFTSIEEGVRQSLEIEQQANRK